MATGKTQLVAQVKFEGVKAEDMSGTINNVKILILRDSEFNARKTNKEKQRSNFLSKDGKFILLINT